MNRCIVVQGPTNPTNVFNIKKYWSGFPILFSTWEGADVSCYTNDDIVIFNKIPQNRGVKNLNLQRVSSLNGILKAKELGYSRVMKWREDMYPTNSSEFIKLFKNEYVNFYSYMIHMNGYITDYFIEGPIDTLIDLFKNIKLHGPYPEHPFTEEIINMKLKNINFVGNELTHDNDVVWTKRKKRLSVEMKDKFHTINLPDKLKKI